MKTPKSTTSRSKTSPETPSTLTENEKPNPPLPKAKDEAVEDPPIDFSSVYNPIILTNEKQVDRLINLKDEILLFNPLEFLEISRKVGYTYYNLDDEGDLEGFGFGKGKNNKPKKFHKLLKTYKDWFKERALPIISVPLYYTEAGKACEDEKERLKVAALCELEGENKIFTCLWSNNNLSSLRAFDPLFLSTSKDVEDSNKNSSEPSGKKFKSSTNDKSSLKTNAGSDSENLNGSKDTAENRAGAGEDSQSEAEFTEKEKDKGTSADEERSTAKDFLLNEDVAYIREQYLNKKRSSENDSNFNRHVNRLYMPIDPNNPKAGVYAEYNGRTYHPDSVKEKVNTDQGFVTVYSFNMKYNKDGEVKEEEKTKVEAKTEEEKASARRPSPFGPARQTDATVKGDIMVSDQMVMFVTGEAWPVRGLGEDVYLTFRLIHWVYKTFYGNLAESESNMKNMLCYFLVDEENNQIENLMIAQCIYDHVMNTKMPGISFLTACRLVAAYKEGSWNNDNMLLFLQRNILHWAMNCGLLETNDPRFSNWEKIYQCMQLRSKATPATNLYNVENLPVPLGLWNTGNYLYVDEDDKMTDPNGKPKKSVIKTFTGRVPYPEVDCVSKRFIENENDRIKEKVQVRNLKSFQPVGIWRCDLGRIKVEKLTAEGKAGAPEPAKLLEWPISFAEGWGKRLKRFRNEGETTHGATKASQRAEYKREKYKSEYAKISEREISKQKNAALSTLFGEANVIANRIQESRFLSIIKPEEAFKTTFEETGEEKYSLESIASDFRGYYLGSDIDNFILANKGHDYWDWIAPRPRFFIWDEEDDTQRDRK